MRKPLASAMVSATFSATPIAMEPEEAVQEHLHGKVLTSRETLTPDAQLLSSSGWSKLSQDAGQSQRQVQIDALRVSKADQSTSYSLPIVTAPPELNIPAEEIENDKALFAELAMQRGEGKVAQTEDQSWYEDEDDIDDVNGFGNTEAGRKARRKVCIPDFHWFCALMARLKHRFTLPRRTKGSATYLLADQVLQQLHSRWTPTMM